MNILLLTIFLSTLLAFAFGLAFVRDRKHRESSSPERDALLPLQEDSGKVVHKPKP